MESPVSTTTPLLQNPIVNTEATDVAPASPPDYGDVQDRQDNGDDSIVTRATLSDMASMQFYTRERWFEELCEGLFKIQHRKTTVTQEVYYGLVHYVSCLFCLAVIPSQMAQAGYDKRGVFVSTALCCGFGSIICGLFANLPFVIAPPAAVAIFLSVYLQNYEGRVGTDVLPKIGSAAVMFSGLFLMLLFYRPLGNFISRLIPTSIQAGTAVGIGLVTALAGAVDINLIVEGKFNVLLQMGHISAAVVIAFAGVVIICVATHYHLKGAFCIAIILCSLSWSIYSGEWPSGLVSYPHTNKYSLSELKDARIPVLVADLLFLYILYLNGLIASLSMIAKLNREDGSTPRGRWIFVLTGCMTCISGYLTGAPVLISPESAAGIKDGAKTGLSALVCGFLFLLSVFFSPLFDAIPKAGTSPILLMIGALLFQNTVRIDWTDVKSATPAFVVLFFIPFTYSVIEGVILGYCVYLPIGICTGELYANTVLMLHIYLPSQLAEKYLPINPCPRISDHIPLLEKRDTPDSVVVTSNLTSRPLSLSTHSTDDLIFTGIGVIDENSNNVNNRSRRLTVDCLVYCPDVENNINQDTRSTDVAISHFSAGMSRSSGKDGKAHSVAAPSKANVPELLRQRASSSAAGQLSQTSSTVVDDNRERTGPQPIASYQNVRGSASNSYGGLSKSDDESSGDPVRSDKQR
jgi:AGZA family xanthine/uracil permease-like MFS transporter